MVPKDQQLKRIQFQLRSIHENRPFLADATYVDDQKSKPVVIFNHGFKGYKDWGPFNLMAEKFANAGFLFIKMNFSHNGTTIQKPTDFADLEAFAQNNFSKELNDTGVLIDALFQKDIPVQEQLFNPEELFLIGHSRGGASVILKANEDSRVRKIVTWAAVSDLEAQYSLEEIDFWKKQETIYIYNSRTGQEMPLHYQLAENYIKNKNRLHVPTAVKNLNIPMLAIHGDKDETVPVASVYEMKKWNSNITTEVIPEANHTFGGTEPFTGNELPADLKKAVGLSINFLKE